MKSFKKNLVLVFALAALASCGKYGYNFEDGYQSGDLTGVDPSDTSLNYVDRSLHERARIYPGMVGNGVHRTKDTTITLDLNFKYVSPQDLKVSVTPLPIFSVGLYAPAGENIKIEVPQGVLGLTVQVGPQTGDLTGESPLRRDVKISTVKELFPGINYVRNPYGGLIWIRAAVKIDNPVDLKFTNAVRTSDFIYGKTNQADWLKDVAANDVPWLELRSNRAVFTVPRSMILQYKNELDINGVLKMWNEIYEKDYYDWMGLTPNNPDQKNSYPELPERGVLDIQLRKPAYAHSGQPWMATQDKHWFMQFTNPDYFFDGPEDAAWGTYHEIGHNYQMGSAWSWSALGETTNNLFIFNGARRLSDKLSTHPSLKNDIPEALAFAATSSAKNFNSGDKPFFRLTPFLQIFNKTKGKNGESGWQFWTYLYTKARNSVYSFSLDEAKIDFFYRALCEFTGKDYARFMDAWGIPVSTSAKKAMRELYDPLDKKIWTYNPLTKTGGDDALDPKYDLIGSDFVWSSNMSTATNESTGKFDALSDGNLSTYWHTCYSGCAVTTTASESAPTYLDLDMKVPQAIRGVYLQNRQTATYRRAAIIWTKVSETAQWVRRGELLLDGNDTQKRNLRKEFKFDKVEEIRYIRFEFNEQNYVSQAHTAIAEAGAFYDPN